MLAARSHASTFDHRPWWSDLYDYLSMSGANSSSQYKQRREEEFAHN